MYKAPFFHIETEDGEVITDFFDSFKFTDSFKKDDVMSLSGKSESVHIVDEPWFAVGQKLVCIFGYKGGLQSVRKLMKIADIDCDYSSTINFTIKAMDFSHFSKKNASVKVWNGTASDIVKELAEKYSMETSDVQDTNRAYTALSQGNKSDFDFIRHLAQRENFQFYVSGNLMTFKPYTLLKSPRRTFTYGIDIIKFKPSMKTSTSEPKAKATATSVVSMSSGEVTTVKKSSKDQGEEKTGEIDATWFFNQDGDFKTKASTDTIKAEDDEQVIVAGTTDKKVAENIAAERNKNASISNLSADLKIIGDPTIQANEIVTIAGVGKRHVGNYLVTEITHPISGSAYISTLKLVKDATKKATGNDAATSSENDQSVNNEIGLEGETEAKERVLRFDANGNEIKG